MADDLDLESSLGWAEAETDLEGPQSSAWFYRVSPHLVLCSRWVRPRPDPPDRHLRVKSGKAFPLGHPSTRLGLDLLREALAARAVQRLLDVGCGSGVLALTAAALGVPRVVGMDLAPGAVQVTRQNARENGLAGPLQVVQGSTECVEGPFDLVIANLPWEVQMDKVSELHRLAASQGRLILAGFRDNQETPLNKRYRQLGWSLARRCRWEFRHPELPPDISFTWVAWLLQRSDRSPKK